MLESLDKFTREPDQVSWRTANFNGLRRDLDSKLLLGSASQGCWIHNLVVKATHGKWAGPVSDTDEQAIW